MKSKLVPKIPNGPLRVYETAYLGDGGSDQASHKIMSGQIEAGSLVDGRPKEINNSSYVSASYQHSSKPRCVRRH